jgi:tRNA pseudouridine38-40 synthase
MPDYRLTLAYDGTDFAGWQRQGPGRGRTVQGVLEDALARLAGAPVAVAGAGRTDAGVHALGQVASFSLPRERSPEEIRDALNALLPRDVRVLAAGAAPPGFHARRSARSKVYRYELDTGAVRVPTRRRHAGHARWRLDAAAVERAADLFVGRQDFASLASSGGSVKTTVRTVLRSEVRWEAPPHAAAGPTLVYEAEADGFLRKMVRSMVGGLVAAGRGAASCDDLHRALLARDRRLWPAPVEPCGLTLVRVDYAEEPALT